MRLFQNVEKHGFRITLVLETNDALGHKLISENEALQRMVKDELDGAGLRILMEMKHEAEYRQVSPLSE